MKKQHEQQEKDLFCVRRTDEIDWEIESRFRKLESKERERFFPVVGALDSKQHNTQKNSIMRQTTLLFLLALPAVSAAFISPTAPKAVGTTTRLWHNKSKKSQKRGGGGGGGFGMATANKQKDTFPYAGAIRPGVQSPQRVVDQADIPRPDYAETGIPSGGTAKRLLPWMIEVKSAAEIEKMRASGKLAREILDLAGRAALPGVTTDEIDTLVHEAILEVSVGFALQFLCKEGNSHSSCLLVFDWSISAGRTHRRSTIMVFQSLVAPR